MWQLWLVLLLYAAWWLWQYRLAVYVEYRGGTLLAVYLLLRVCGGYARPLRLPLRRWWEAYRRRKRRPVKKAAFELRHLHIAWRFLLQQARVEQLSLTCRIGTADAMHTALCCGAAQMLAGLWFSHLSHLVGSVPPCPPLTVQPDYTQPGFSLRQRCIISLSMGNIIIAIGKSLRQSLAKRTAMAGKETSYVQ